MTDLEPKPVVLPDAITEHLAARMAEAYERAIDEKHSLAEAMQLAYQVLRRAMLEEK